jgi:hypothetical protein
LNNWDPDNYDKKVGFVSEFGKEVLRKKSVDAVFSNALLHWVKIASLAIKSIYLLVIGVQNEYFLALS